MMRSAYIKKCFSLIVAFAVFFAIKAWFLNSISTDDENKISGTPIKHVKYSELLEEIKREENETDNLLNSKTSVGFNSDVVKYNRKPSGDEVHFDSDVGNLKDHLRNIKRPEDNVAENRYQKIIDSASMPPPRRYFNNRRHLIRNNRQNVEENSLLDNVKVKDDLVNDNVEFVQKVFGSHIKRHEDAVERTDDITTAAVENVANEIDTDSGASYHQNALNANLSNVLFSATPMPTNSRHNSLKIDRKRTNSSRSEFGASRDSFGKLDALPDYDLPLLTNKSSHEVVANLSQSQNDIAVTEKQKMNSNRINQPWDDVLSTSQVQNFSRKYTQLMSDVSVLGIPNANKSYAVFSTTIENREATTFVFLVPLTVLAWKRIGFDSIVIVVCSRDEWDYDPMYRYVQSSAQKLGALFIFLEPRPEKSIMISQVSRLFAANIVWSAFSHLPGIDDIYIVISDSDIWPIYGDAYLLPRGYDILSLNSDCCMPFSHRGRKYRMLPMANVGMRVRTWRELTKYFGETPNSIDDILSIFVREFGTVALRPARKGENVGWFLDQMMISILIANWVSNNSSGGGGALQEGRKVKFAARDVGVDRLDRNGWNIGDDVSDKVDAHVLLETFIPGVWVRMLQLLRLLYGERSSTYNFCIEYFDNFQELFLTKYRGVA